jgi:hypothetical protein
MTPEMIPGMTPDLKEELIQWLHAKTSFWSEASKNKVINSGEYEYALGSMFAFGAVLDQLSTLGNRRTDPLPETPEKDMIRFEWLMQYVNAPRDEIDKRMQYPEEKERVEKAEKREKLLRLFDFVSEGQKAVPAAELKAVSDAWQQEKSFVQPTSEECPRCHAVGEYVTPTSMCCNNPKCMTTFPVFPKQETT